MLNLSQCFRRIRYFYRNVYSAIFKECLPKRQKDLKQIIRSMNKKTHKNRNKRIEGSEATISTLAKKRSVIFLPDPRKNEKIAWRRTRWLVFYLSINVITQKLETVITT